MSYPQDKLILKSYPQNYQQQLITLFSLFLSIFTKKGMAIIPVFARIITY